MNRQEDERRWVLEALDAYELPLVRYALRLVGDLETARDVVQDVFLKLCGQSQRELAPRMPAWLFAVCRNRSLDVLRGNGHRSQLTPPGVAVVHNVDHSSADATSRETDPAQSAEQAELHGELLRLIDRLPDNQREAIDLWAEGFRYAEIGQILGAKEGHVRVLVHRGLKALREHPRIQTLLQSEDPLPAAKSL